MSNKRKLGGSNATSSGNAAFGSSSFATPSSATPSSATPSSATPSSATPSSATPFSGSCKSFGTVGSSATPFSATPSSATPSSATPFSGFRKSFGTFGSSTIPFSATPSSATPFSGFRKFFGTFGSSATPSSATPFSGFRKSFGTFGSFDFGTSGDSANFSSLITSKRQQFAARPYIAPLLSDTDSDASDSDTSTSSPPAKLSDFSKFGYGTSVGKASDLRKSVGKASSTFSSATFGDSAKLSKYPITKGLLTVTENEAKKLDKKAIEWLENSNTKAVANKASGKYVKQFVKIYKKLRGKEPPGLDSNDDVTSGDLSAHSPVTSTFGARGKSARSPATSTFGSFGARSPVTSTFGARGKSARSPATSTFGSFGACSPVTSTFGAFGDLSANVDIPKTFELAHKDQENETSGGIDFFNLVKTAHSYVIVNKLELEEAGSDREKQFKAVKYYGQVSELLPFERLYKHYCMGGKFTSGVHQMLIIAKHDSGFGSHPNDKKFASLVYEYFLEEINRRENCFDPSLLALAGSSSCGYSSHVFRQIIKEDKQNGNVIYKQVYDLLVQALDSKNYVTSGVYKCPDPECESKEFLSKHQLVVHVEEKHCFEQTEDQWVNLQLAHKDQENETLGGIDFFNLVKTAHSYVIVDKLELEEAGSDREKQFKAVKYYGQISGQLPHERAYQHGCKSRKFTSGVHQMLIISKHDSGFGPHPNDKKFASLIYEYFLEEINQRKNCFDPTQLASAGGSSCGYSSHVFRRIIKEDKQNGNVIYKQVYDLLVQALDSKNYVTSGVYKCPDPECESEGFLAKKHLVFHIANEHDYGQMLFRCKKCDPFVEFESEPEYCKHYEENHRKTITCMKCVPPVELPKDKYSKHYEENHHKTVVCMKCEPPIKFLKADYHEHYAKNHQLETKWCKKCEPPVEFSVEEYNSHYNKLHREITTCMKCVPPVELPTAEYQKHYEEMHRQETKWCKKCDPPIELLLDEYNKHYEENHRRETTICKQCEPPVEFPNAEYQKHYEEMHRQETKWCKKCDPPVEFSVKEYNKHYQENHRPKTTTCMKCEPPVELPNAEYQKHYEENHRRETKWCKKCDPPVEFSVKEYSKHYNKLHRVKRTKPKK